MIPKGQGNKGKKPIKKGQDKKTETPKKQTKKPTPEKKVLIVVPRRSRRMETEEEKWRRHHLGESGLIPEDPKKTHKLGFVYFSFFHSVTYLTMFQIHVYYRL